MTFTQSVKTCLTKYVVFSGRASRSEFWWFVLFSYAGSLLLAFIETIINSSATGEVAILTTAFALATFLPSISVAVRRLHDRGRSGWWWWIILIPMIGIIVYLFWVITKGDEGPNQYGDDPVNPTGGFDSRDDDDETPSSSIPTVKR